MNTLPKAFRHPYKINPDFKTSAVYFSMEFAIDQPLKIYSGGLGFLAGSHMRSAFDLNQNMVGIGILWKYGYYDQYTKDNHQMGARFKEKFYSFLEDTGIKFSIQINGHNVWVKAFYLDPNIFGSAPMFLLSTDLPENDFLARTTTHKLYDSDPKAKIAQCMVLGLGGAKLLEALNYEPDVYHFNEAHAVSAVFPLFKKYGSVEEVKKRTVFTTHTPEEAGNEKHDINLLYKMNFFDGLPLEEVKAICDMAPDDEIFNHTLTALRFSRIANGVSELHGEVARHMWEGYEGICPITHITNAQNKKYWADEQLEVQRAKNDLDGLKLRKRQMKKELFDHVADKTGNIFDPDVLTIVWARRFAEYKRADLITRDREAFYRLLTDEKRPVQIIFAGKPYPMDYNAIRTFDNLMELSLTHKNMAVLTGYELRLSKLLKNGADIWLNNPRVTREASGTSGMTAAMNGAINFSTNDGWVREFNEFSPESSFVLPVVDHRLPHYVQDQDDLDNMYQMLDEEILPLYYDKNKNWWKKAQKSMSDVVPFFDSNRMAAEYYTKLYNAK